MVVWEEIFFNKGCGSFYFLYFHGMKQELLNKIQSIIGNEAADVKDIIGQLRSLLYESELLGYRTIESKSIGELVSENLKQILDESKQKTLIKSGFNAMDEMIGGFSRGEMVVIGGRPGMGKTQLLVSLALNISKNLPLLYFSFDLSLSLLTNRFLAAMSGIAMDDILRHDLMEEEKATLQGVGEQLGKLNIYINDSGNTSLTALRAHIEKQVQEKGVQVIMVDYLQMLSSSRYRNQRDLEIGHISRELKNIAKDMNVCVIVSSQLSRSVESRNGLRYPRLSDLRESGAIEQDADKVLFIYRPEYYGILKDEIGESTEGITEFLLAKNRNGKLGSVKLMHDKNFTSFIEIEEYKKEFTISDKRLDELDTNPW